MTKTNKDKVPRQIEIVWNSAHVGVTGKSDGSTTPKGIMSQNDWGENAAVVISLGDVYQVP